MRASGHARPSRASATGAPRLVVFARDELPPPPRARRLAAFAAGGRAAAGDPDDLGLKKDPDGAGGEAGPAVQEEADKVLFLARDGEVQQRLACVEPVLRRLANAHAYEGRVDGFA